MPECPFVWTTGTSICKKRYHVCIFLCNFDHTIIQNTTKIRHNSPFLRFFDKYIRLLDYTFRSFYGNSRRKQEEAIHLVPLPDANESDVDESSDEELDDDCDMM